MRLFNEISADLKPDGEFSIIVDRLCDETGSLELADDWCRGYALGIAPRETEWKEALEAPELRDAFLPILLLAGTGPNRPDRGKEPERHEAMIDALPGCAVEIHEWWRKKFAADPRAMMGGASTGPIRRTAPKISPNAPCPCGSGKKYKRCCSPWRAV